ncbi:hypothetical protein H5410_055573 [Solanum commersonii]|uniref:Uncharacterized protein n=1 Tax=Solanum commersonii TaxID=4109 RepID=A0A9J5WJI9_SOLCO|nr:hypothetical protein H5410_055573 [Solanum commersonii]
MAWKVQQGGRCTLEEESLDYRNLNNTSCYWTVEAYPRTEATGTNSSHIWALFSVIGGKLGFGNTHGWLRPSERPIHGYLVKQHKTRPQQNRFHQLKKPSPGTLFNKRLCYGGLSHTIEPAKEEDSTVQQMSTVITSQLWNMFFVILDISWTMPNSIIELSLGQNELDYEVVDAPICDLMQKLIRR